MNTQRIAKLAALLMLLTLLSSLTFRDASATPYVAEAQLTVLEENTDGLRLQLQTPAAVLSEGNRLSAAGLTDTLHQPGAPNLPALRTYVALPPGATGSATIRSVELSVSQVPDVRAEAVPVMPAEDLDGASVLAPDGSGLVRDGQVYVRLERDPAVYETNAFFPATMVTLSEPIQIRDVRVALLTIVPFQYNPVTDVLRQALRLEVSVSFMGASESPHRPLPESSQVVQSIDDLVLNPDQLEAWRSLPVDTGSISPLVPAVGDSYRFKIATDGIYEITYDQLAAAGMNVGAVNPATFEMMTNGEPVAYQFVGDADATFEPGEGVRFFGWNSGRSRVDKQYSIDNVFWLWPDGTPSLVATGSNTTTYPIASTWLSSVTKEPTLKFFGGWTDQWDQFPNEPDAWYWRRFDALTGSVSMDTPHPAPTGPDAFVTIEFTSKEPNSEVTAIMNGHPNAAVGSWVGKSNTNITTTVPLTNVLSTNLFAFTFNRIRHFYLNRITVDYTRLFIADADQLQFTDEIGGQRRFEVSGYSSDDLANIAVWDTTNRLAPVVVPMTAANVSGSGPFTYTFGTNHPADAEFIVTSNIRAVQEIERYVPTALDPPGGDAEWLAISHADFLTATAALATHRQDPLFGGYSTIVVDIDDVVNQYGAGLPTPKAIQNYLGHALATWTTPPRYLLMVGDSTDSPDNLVTNTWPDDSVPNYALTAYEYKDPYQGRIPTDLPLTLVVGDDLAPDIAIGRIPAQTEAEVINAVTKVILYETNQVTPESWQENILFVAAPPDDPYANNFCAWNHVLANEFPGSFETVVDPLCLPEGATSADVITLTQTLQFNYISNPESGASIFNYRGHGALQTWAGQNGPTILTVTDNSWLGFWGNPYRPLIVVSADCLDGYFVAGGIESLAETFLTHNSGTAAHFSSSGLGTTDIHTVLETFFYEGIFSEGATAIGDAVNYGKIAYLATLNYKSLLYSFILEGDPAMQVFRPDVALDVAASQSQVEVGNITTFNLNVSNAGILPDNTTLEVELSQGLSFVSATGPVVSIGSGNAVTLALTQAIARAETVTIQLMAQIDPEFSGESVSISAEALPQGFDLDYSNHMGEASILVLYPDSTHYYFLPSLQIP